MCSLVPEDQNLSEVQVDVFRHMVMTAKETVSRLAGDHRDLHSSVSRVGKTIDRNFSSDFALTACEDIFTLPERIELLNQVICQHFYRRGYHDVSKELAKVSSSFTCKIVEYP